MIVQFGDYGRAILRDLPKDVYHGLITFAISNFFYMIGLLVTSSTGSISISLNLDILLFMLIFQYRFLFQNILLATFEILGWIAAAIFVRIKFPEAGNRPIFYGAGFISIFALIFILYLSFITILSNLLNIGLLLPTLLALLTSMGFIIVIVYLINIIFAIPGLLVLHLTRSSVKTASTNLSISPNFLVMNGWTSSKPKVCPFKDPELNGCSYLGYRAPPTQLLCDYPDTFRQCLLYAHLYDKRLEVIDFLAED